jgi:hypothetical protein
LTNTRQTKPTNRQTNKTNNQTQKNPYFIRLFCNITPNKQPQNVNLWLKKHKKQNTQTKKTLRHKDNLQTTTQKMN